ncbi:MAG: type II toxin-antitoxin system VapC family toxin [Leptonema sp. (in: Bacteria)]|nr:type II toxin-antitoxin system VapC family toxin [Leptonema sp. (in: bacteria)]
MRIYIDSSWLLRVILQQDKVKPLPKNAVIFSSILLKVECLRVLDRQHKRKRLSDNEFTHLIQQLTSYTNLIELIELERSIVLRAAEPFLLPLATLDALHLATALKIREIERNDIHFATFDDELALATIAYGFTVIN